MTIWLSGSNIGLDKLKKCNCHSGSATATLDQSVPSACTTTKALPATASA